MGHSGAAAAVQIDASGHLREQAEQTLRAFYDGTDWSAELTDGPYFFRYIAAGTTDLSLRTSRMRGRLRGDALPTDDYVVQWTMQGTPVIDAGQQTVLQQRLQPQLFPAHRRWTFDYSDYDQRLVHLNKTMVDALAVETRSIQSSAIVFDHSVAPSDEATALWRDVVGLVGRAIQRGAVPPLLWSELTRMTAAAFLELYPPHGRTVPEAVLAPEHARLRRALEYLHENAHLPLTPTQIAQAADVSVRTLQFSFQRVLGMPPLAYLRQVRLDHVYDELRHAYPGETTVAATARRWGFAHQGRFAASYAERFNEHPRETLRR